MVVLVPWEPYRVSLKPQPPVGGRLPRSRNDLLEYNIRKQVSWNNDVINVYYHLKGV